MSKKTFKEILEEEQEKPERESPSLTDEEMKSYDLAALKLRIPITREIHTSHHSIFRHAEYFQEGSRSKRKVDLARRDNEQILELLNDSEAVRLLSREQGVSQSRYDKNVRKVAERIRKMYNGS